MWNFLHAMPCGHSGSHFACSVGRRAGREPPVQKETVLKTMQRMVVAERRKATEVPRARCDEGGVVGGGQMGWGGGVGKWEKVSSWR